MSFCLNFIGNEWFLHTKLPLETTKYLGSHIGNMDFLLLSQSDQSHKMGLFLRISINPLQIYWYILKASTDFFTIF